MLQLVYGLLLGSHFYLIRIYKTFHLFLEAIHFHNLSGLLRIDTFVEPMSGLNYHQVILFLFFGYWLCPVKLACLSEVFDVFFWLWRLFIACIYLLFKWDIRLNNLNARGWCERFFILRDWWSQVSWIFVWLRLLTSIQTESSSHSNALTEARCECSSGIFGACIATSVIRVDCWSPCEAQTVGLDGILVEEFLFLLSHILAICVRLSTDFLGIF